MDSTSLADMRGDRSKVLGYRLIEMGGGRGRVAWTPPANLSNPLGFVHGGFVATMVDDCAGIAVASMLDRFRPFPTASMHVDFLRGVRMGTTVTCESVVVRAGRRLTVADVAIRDDAGTLLARGTCMFALDLSDSELVGFTALS